MVPDLPVESRRGHVEGSTVKADTDLVVATAYASCSHGLHQWWPPVAHNNKKKRKRIFIGKEANLPRHTDEDGRMADLPHRGGCRFGKKLGKEEEDTSDVGIRWRGEIVPGGGEIMEDIGRANAAGKRKGRGNLAKKRKEGENLGAGKRNHAGNLGKTNNATKHREMPSSPPDAR